MVAVDYTVHMVYISINNRSFETTTNMQYTHTFPTIICSQKYGFLILYFVTKKAGRIERENNDKGLYVN